MRARRLTRPVAALALAAFIIPTAIMLAAGPASAHAILESESPLDGSTVATSPSQISLTFNENVTVAIGGVRLLSCSGGRKTIGTPGHPPGNSHVVVVGDIPTLEPGTYAVSWRVISADSHPVSGGYTFTVGSGAAQSASSCSGAGPTHGSKTVGVLFGGDRLLLYAGLALLIGGVVFYLLIARGTSAARGVRRVIWIGWGLTVFATIVGVLLQGPYAEGSGIGDATSSTVIRDILKTTYGHIAVRRLILLAIVFVLLLVITRLRDSAKPPVWLLVSSGIVGVLIAATPGLAGHAGTGDEVWAASPLDTIHVLAMSIWFGGLVCLVVAALGGGFSGSLRRGLVVFSRLAFWCVIALILSGVFASWRQVGFTIHGYTGTSYGNLLLVKLFFVAVVLVVLVYLSRSIVRKREAAPLDATDADVAAIDESTVRGLRRSVGGEVAIGLVVLIVTAMLVNAFPARSALAPKLFTSTVKAGSGSDSMLVSIIVDPARVGKNVVHIYSETPQGQPLASRISAQIALPSQNIAPINANLKKGAGINHYTTDNLVMIAPGKWQFIIHVLRGADNDTATVILVPIRS